MAGSNLRLRVWRISTPTDDATGGAVVTGTVAYEQVFGRIQETPAEQLLLQQGLETVRSYTGVIEPGTLLLYERDEIEVVEPKDGIYYGCRFRIVRVRYSDHNPRDPRNKILLNLTRNVRAHSSQ